MARRRTTKRSAAVVVDYAANPDTRSCARCGGIADVLFAHRTPPAGDGVRDAFAGLDAGIAPYVRTLWENGIETFESCEGPNGPCIKPDGLGHAYPEPTVAFGGGASEGYRAYAIAKYFGLPVSQVRRVWYIQDGEMTGPYWHMTFTRMAEIGAAK